MSKNDVVWINDVKINVFSRHFYDFMMALKCFALLKYISTKEPIGKCFFDSHPNVIKAAGNRHPIGNVLCIPPESSDSW